ARPGLRPRVDRPLLLREEPPRDLHVPVVVAARGPPDVAVDADEEDGARGGAGDAALSADGLSPRRPPHQGGRRWAARLEFPRLPHRRRRLLPRPVFEAVPPEIWAGGGREQVEGVELQLPGQILRP